MKSVAEPTGLSGVMEGKGKFMETLAEVKSKDKVGNRPVASCVVLTE